MRIEFDLESSAILQFDELKSKAGCGTRKELFNNALTLFEWAVEEAVRGRVFGSVEIGDKGGYQDFNRYTLAPLEQLRRRSRIKPT